MFNKYSSFLLAGILLISLNCGIVNARQISAPPGVGSYKLAPMLKQVMPAIVNISVQGEAQISLVVPNQTPAPKHAQPSERKPHRFRGFGSGVILDEKAGYIVTNAHIVKDAKLITVTLNDGRRIKAKLIGSDPGTDIAVIKIKPSRLQGLKFADSSELQVGDFVVAIGNPFGLDQHGTDASVTFGIVSALKRSELHMGSLESYIQTDAAINPGNSGGALIDMEGRLVGINSAIISPFQGNVGVGLAIPVNMVRSISSQLIKYGSVHRGLLGILMQPMTPELAEAFGLASSKGVIISQVNPGSPAAVAGLKAGDVITKIENKTVSDAMQIRNLVTMLRVGSELSLQVSRQGKLKSVTIKVEDQKQMQEKQQTQNPFLYGLALRNISEESPIHGHVTGVLITGATESSAAWRSGLRPGDVIVDVDRIRTTSAEQLQQTVKGLKKSQLLVHVLRGQGSLYLVLR